MIVAQTYPLPLTLSLVYQKDGKYCINNIVVFVQTMNINLMRNDRGILAFNLNSAGKTEPRHNAPLSEEMAVLLAMGFAAMLLNRSPASTSSHDDGIQCRVNISLKWKTIFPMIIIVTYNCIYCDMNATKMQMMLRPE